MRPSGVRWVFTGRARELELALRTAVERRLARLVRVLPDAGRARLTLLAEGLGWRVRLRVEDRRTALAGTGAGASVLEAATDAVAHLRRTAATARESRRSQARRAVRARG